MDGAGGDMFAGFSQGFASVFGPAVQQAKQSAAEAQHRKDVLGIEKERLGLEKTRVQNEADANLLREDRENVKMANEKLFNLESLNLQTQQVQDARQGRADARFDKLGEQSFEREKFKSEEAHRAAVLKQNETQALDARDQAERHAWDAHQRQMAELQERYRLEGINKAEQDKRARLERSTDRLLSTRLEMWKTNANIDAQGAQLMMERSASLASKAMEAAVATKGQAATEADVERIYNALEKLTAADTLPSYRSQMQPEDAARINAVRARMEKARVDGDTDTMIQLVDELTEIMPPIGGSNGSSQNDPTDIDAKAAAETKRLVGLTQLTGGQRDDLARASREAKEAPRREAENVLSEQGHAFLSDNPEKIGDLFGQWVAERNKSGGGQAIAAVSPDRLNDHELRRFYQWVGRLERERFSRDNPLQSAFRSRR